MTPAGAKKMKTKAQRAEDKKKKAEERKAQALAANNAAKIKAQTLFTKKRTSKTIVFDKELEKDAFTHPVTIEGSVKLKGKVTGEAVLKLFQRKVGDTIADLRKITTWDIAILPLETADKSARAVVNAKGLTKYEMAYSMKKDFLLISNTRAFTDIDDDKQRGLSDSTVSWGTTSTQPTPKLLMDF